MKFGKVVVFGLLFSVVVCNLAPAAPPDFKAGQSVEVREGDEWSTATVVKKEGRKFQIRYETGGEEWVTAERLRAGKESAGGSAGQPEPGKPAPTAAAKPRITVEGPFTEINLKEVKSAPKRSSSSLTVKPTTQPSSPFTDLTPAAGTDLRHVDDLIACIDVPGTFVVVGGRHGDETPLLCLDVNKPGQTESRTFGVKDQKIIGAAGNGRVLLTQATAWGAQSLHLWEQQDGAYQLKANYVFINDGKNAKPDWARLMTPTRLLLRSGFGHTYLIDLPGKRQLAFIDCGDIRIHPSGQYLLSSKDGAAIVLRPTDLSIMASFPKTQSAFAIDPTGEHVLRAEGNSVIVTKISTNKDVTTVNGLHLRGRLDLVNPTSVILEGRTYYDLKTGIPVWNYAVPGASALLPSGQMLYVSTAGGQTVIAMAAVPDAVGAAALSNASPEKFLIQPGARIAISGDLASFGNVEVARSCLEKIITSAGHVVDDQAGQYKLTANCTPGPTGKFSVQVFQMGGPPAVKEYDAPSSHGKVVLTRDGETIWETLIVYQAQVMVNRRKDEPLEQAIANAGKPDPGRLGNLALPGYLVKPAGAGKGQATLGESTLTRNGFAASNEK